MSSKKSMIKKGFAVVVVVTVAVVVVLSKVGVVIEVTPRNVGIDNVVELLLVLVLLFW